MRVRLLGPLEVRDADGTTARVSAPMLRALLVALALRPGQVVPASELLGQLWGEELPQSARTTLRNYVMRLRKALPEGWIRTAAGGYQLVLDESETDLGVFRDRVHRSRALTATDPDAALELLEGALGLWRGTPMEDIGDCPLRDSEQPALEEMRLTAMEERFDLKTTLGRHREIIDELTAALHHHYLRERLARQLMLALHRSGRTPDALVVYRTVRERLIDELGLEPGLELRQLEESILRDDPGLRLPAEPRSAARPARGPVMPNFPAPVATFVARGRELALVDGILARAHATAGICLIDGPGGVGKSALAVRAARAAAERFPDGLLYVDLRGADPHNPALTPLAALRLLASALSVPVKNVPTDLEAATALYRERLRERRVLILLDNALDARQVRPLLPVEPGSAALVTSRAVLTGLADGHHVHLGRLDDDEAVELLRSAVGGAGSHPAPPEWYALARLCGHLPLALRIVATRMAARPGWSLGDWITVLREEHGRMEQLRVADLDLRASLMVSIDQLARGDDPVDLLAAELFPRLGVAPLTRYTPGLVAAAADCPVREAEKALERLADARIIDSPRPGEYTLHDLLRSAAAWQAGKLAPEQRRAVLGRVASWFVRRLNTLVRHYPASQHFLARADSIAARFPTQTEAFTGAEQAMRWADDVAEDVVLLADLLAAPEYDQGEELGGEPLSRFAYYAVATQETYFGLRLAWTEQERLCDTVLRVARRRGDARAEAIALSQLGRSAGQVQDLGRASELLERAGELLEQLGETEQLLATMSNRIACLAMDGRPSEAKRVGEAARAEAQRLGFRDTEVTICANLAYLRLKTGDPDGARELALHALGLARLPYNRIMLSCLIAEYHLGSDQFEEAARWAERAMRHTAGHPVDPYTTAHARNLLATALRHQGRIAAADGHDDKVRAQMAALNARAPRTVTFYYADSSTPGRRGLRTLIDGADDR
ncbi:AfsR/SARP family transcriptional regulator [Streptomyces lonarensis]|uniref:AfsR/SARP family transcriptional regulator n=2 Tax=Streptomyces lonarensis TaxID=700599 RepID=A0A7X6HZ60_9ACTN|nr:AfsR/SARP family transcriptional regulator [Streptomyces lonarensis]NJQ06316.1 AfsR/SARP family transcriptional regulator [Streptomyces lonarensis]